MKKFLLPLLLLLSMHHTTKPEPVTVATAALSVLPSFSFSSVMNFVAVGLALNFFTQGADAADVASLSCEGLRNQQHKCKGTIVDAMLRTCEGDGEHHNGIITKCSGRYRAMGRDLKEHECLGHAELFINGKDGAYHGVKCTGHWDGELGSTERSLSHYRNGQK